MNLIDEMLHGTDAVGDRQLRVRRVAGNLVLIADPTPELEGAAA